MVTLALLVVLSIEFCVVYRLKNLGRPRFWVWEYLFGFVPWQAAPSDQTGSRDVSSASSFPHQILARPPFPNMSFEDVEERDGLYSILLSLGGLISYFS